MTSGTEKFSTTFESRALIKIMGIAFYLKDSYIYSYILSLDEMMINDYIIDLRKMFDVDHFGCLLGNILFFYFKNHVYSVRRRS